MLQLKTWHLKACPRCRGDVYIDRDIDGWYGRCLQCGCETAFPFTLRVHQPTTSVESDQFVDSIKHLSRL